MPLSKPINAFMGAVRAFLASEVSPVLELDVKAELEPQAAKLLDGVASEADDLLVPVEVLWESTPALSATIAEALAEVALQAQEAFGEDEAPRFPLPKGVLPATQAIPEEVRLVEYAETIQRALSNHVRRLVIVLAVRCDEPRREACALAIQRLVCLTGTPGLKWILFGSTRLFPQEVDVLPRPRLRPHAFDDRRSAAGLYSLAIDPGARVEVSCNDRVLYPLKGAVEHQRVPNTNHLVVFLEGISYVNRTFYFTEARRALSKKCVEMERASSGGQHAQPLYDEALELVGHPEAEIHFAWFCERMAKALLRDEHGLIVVLAPSLSTPAAGLAESVETLACNAAAARVRYLVVDPRLPLSFEQKRLWLVSRAKYELSEGDIELGLKDRLAAPDCSPLERLRYTSALASLAMAKDNPETAIELGLAALGLARQCEGGGETTNAWYGLGTILYQCAAFEPAEQAYAECVDRSLDEGNSVLAAHGSAGLGHTFFMRKMSDEASKCYAASGALFRKLGHTHGRLYAMTWDAEAIAQKGDFKGSLARFEEALALCNDVDRTQADAYQATLAELYARKAVVHGKANESQLERQCRIEAERLGATAPICDHP